MMKTNHAARLGALALALTLVSTCLMGGTLAKYVTEVTGTATATVAKWSFDAKNGDKSIATQEYKIDLGDTTNRVAYEGTDIKEGVIAPGTEGSFAIVVDAKGSEVGLNYTIRFTEANNIPDNLEFYSNSTYEASSKIDNLFSDSNVGFDGKIDASVNENDKSVTKNIYWKWPYATAEGDKVDTSAGSKDDGDRKMTFTITVTGTQISPTEVSKS